MWRPASRDVSTSRGGEFELERFVGLWDDEVLTGTWWVLRERATGVVRLDTSNVKTGDVRWTADGGLLVRLKHGIDNQLFRVEPVDRTFRDLAQQGATQPIEGLQAAVDAAARKTGADGRPIEPPYDYVERDFSPDGSIMIEFTVEPQRMSHETRTPRIVETATGGELLNLSDSMFDGSVTWRGDNGIDLFLRHYTRSGGLSVQIDPARGVFSFPQEGDREYPIDRLQAETERGFDRACARAEKAARHVEKAFNPPRFNFGRFLLFLALAVVLLVAIVGIKRWTSTPAPQELTPLPSFPRPGVTARRAHSVPRTVDWEMAGELGGRLRR